MPALPCTKISRADFFNTIERTRTDRFGLMPIGSANVATWWLGDRQLSEPRWLQAAFEPVSKPVETVENLESVSLVT